MEYDIPSINYGNIGSERCPNCGSERSIYVGQSKNDDADLAGAYLSRYFPIYSTWYTNENGMYVEVPVYGGSGDNATTVHVSWEQIRNDERPYFRYDNEYDSSRRKSVRKYYDDPFNEEQCHEFPSIADEQYNDTSDEFCSNCGEEDCKLTMMDGGYWLCDDCFEELGYGRKSMIKGRPQTDMSEDDIFEAQDGRQFGVIWLEGDLDGYDEGWEIIEYPEDYPNEDWVDTGIFLSKYSNSDDVRNALVGTFGITEITHLGKSVHKSFNDMVKEQRDKR